MLCPDIKTNEEHWNTSSYDKDNDCQEVCVHEYMNFIARRPKAKIPTASLQFADAENRVKQILDILAAIYFQEDSSNTYL